MSSKNSEEKITIPFNAKRQIENFLFTKSDCYQFECDDEDYFFIANKLQIYNLDNSYIKEYLKIGNSVQDEVTTYLSVDQTKQIHAFLVSEIEKNPQPDMAKSGGTTIKSLVLNVADGCNLDCIYCFAFKDMGWSNKFMDIAKAKEAIQFLVAQNPKAKQYSIVLFGGEPFLNIRLIKQLTQYCTDHIINKLGKKVSFSATTNGTVLNPEIIEVLKKYTFHLIVSFDGPKEIHDKNRPFLNNRGSFEKILKNLETLKKHKIPFSLRPTITSDCKQIVEIADFLEKFGVELGLEFVQNTWYKVSDSIIYTEARIRNLEEQYESLIVYYYNRIINNHKIYCKNIVEALSRIHYQSAKEIACNAGRSIVTINHDGNMHTCQNISNIPETKIGALNEKINHDMLAAFQAISVTDLPGCNACWLRFLCGGACFAEKYIDNRTVTDPVKFRCDIKEIQWKNYLYLYQKLKNNYPSYFDNLYPLQSY